MLETTEITGRVVFLGVVLDRRETLCAEPRERVAAGFEGFEGEYHGGLTRPSCTRVRKLYPSKGTEIRNTRQLSILSAEELAGIADGLGLERLDPAWLGASIVFEGIPALTTLPPASRLLFDSGTCLTVDIENGPCRFPAEVIEAHHPGQGMAFPKIARGRRGVTGWVERPGTIALGDTARLFVPPLRAYAPLAPAESLV
ncbi:MAG: sulfurase [Pseudomonadota bacterium]